MNRQELIMRFSLRTLTDTQLKITHMPLKESAVLLAFIERNNELCLLLTKRSQHLRHHPGQISFPGGKHDVEDENLKTTAIRETQEELGIEFDDIDLFGELPFHDTITGFRIKPYLGFVDQRANITANVGEVSDVIEVPIKTFLFNPTHFMLPIIRPNLTVNVYFKPSQGHAIWGATAAIIEQVRLLLED
ncbi:CoA pyrophosphatase [Psychrobium sp. nBUS_13]|uniref:CoA pyrophosphatase n=1 Tax=Psychrobium sp. nBUS_13 TaxID=3395319 RepID=UPI003EB94DF6